MRIADIVDISFVDGPGNRLTIFYAGCAHDCEGCHNKEYQKFNIGKEYHYEDLISYIIFRENWISGVTLTGGDPLFQQAETILFLKQLKKQRPNLNVMLYTGFLFEQINPEVKQYVDIIVDGKYDKTKPGTKWTGSNNQRVFEKTNKVWRKIKDEEITY